MNYSKLFILSILPGLIFAGLFSFGVYAFAVYGVDEPFPIGNTTNPTCAPGSSANCKVASPAAFSFSANNFSGSGSFITTGSIKNSATNSKHFFGANNEASIYYDGTNLVINPREDGAGVVSMSRALSMGSNSITTTGTITAGTLKVGTKYTFPTVDGTSGQVMATNGSGVITWTTPSTGAAYSFGANNFSGTGSFTTTNSIRGGTLTDGTASLTGGSLTSVKLGSLTGNGFVKTSGSNGTLSVDTNTYLTAESDPTWSSEKSSYVQNSRKITINGVQYDLSQDRAWTINATSPLSGNASGAVYMSGYSLYDKNGNEIIGGSGDSLSGYATGAVYMNGYNLYDLNGYLITGGSGFSNGYATGPLNMNGYSLYDKNGNEIIAGGGGGGGSSLSGNASGAIYMSGYSLYDKNGNEITAGGGGGSSLSGYASGDIHMNGYTLYDSNGSAIYAGGGGSLSGNASGSIYMSGYSLYDRNGNEIMGGGGGGGGSSLSGSASGAIYMNGYSLYDKNGNELTAGGGGGGSGAISGSGGSYYNYYSDTSGNGNYGYYNFFVGLYAGYNNYSGSYNNFFGNYAGYNNYSGANNNFLGYYAGYSSYSGGDNNFFGSFAGYANNSGNYNNFLGTSAGYSNYSGANNNFLGYYAGYGNYSGYENIFIGSYSGYGSSSGSGDLFLGNSSGYYNNGSNNVFLGAYSGKYESGSNKLYIDSLDRGGESQGIAGSLIYGEFNSTASSQLFKINGQVEIPLINTGDYTTLTIDSYGRLYKSSSSLRYKEEVKPLEQNFSKILQANPVSFKYKGSDNINIGYIAEDLDAMGLTDLVIYDSLGRPDAIRYDKVPLYLNEIIKKQQIDIDSLKIVAGLSNLGSTGNGTISGVNTTNSITQAISNLLSSVGITINNGITYIKNLNAETATIKGLQLVDQDTGEIYCTWVKSGEMMKAKGDCETVFANLAINPPIVINSTAAPATQDQVEQTAEAVQKTTETVQRIAEQFQQTQGDSIEQAINQAQDAAQDAIDVARSAQEAAAQVQEALLQSQEVSTPESPVETPVQPTLEIGEAIQSSGASLINGVTKVFKGIIFDSKKMYASIVDSIYNLWGYIKAILK